MTSEILLLWLPSLVISLISFGLLIYLSYRGRRKLDEIRQLAHEYAQQRVESFLQRETQGMRLRLKSPTPGQASQPLDQLRLLWLEAEAAALIEHGRRRSNYELLLHAAQPIARLLNRPPAASAKIATAVVSEQLSKARSTLASQGQTIAQYRQRMATAINEMEPEAGTEFGAALNNVEQNNETLLATIARLENELDTLQHKLDNTQQTHGTRKHAGKPDLLIVTNEAKRDSVALTAQDLLQETEQAYRQSVSEMNRIRDINSQQRQLILQLDKELALVRKDSAQHDISSDTLDKLKLQLRDYENCTIILEEEANTLRDRIDALKKIIVQEDQPDEVVVNAPPQPQDASVSECVDVLSLLQEVVDLDDARAVVARLIEWLQQKKLSAVVSVRTDTEHIWGSSDSGVDQHSKQLLQSIQALPGKPRVDIDEGVMLIHPALRVLVYQSSTLAENGGELANRLAMITGIIEHWLAAARAKMPTPNKHSESELHGPLVGILAQYNYIIKEHARVDEKFRAELRDFFSATGFSDIQHQVVDTMLDDFDAQLDIIGKASKLVYTRLKAIVEEMENELTH